MENYYPQHLPENSIQIALIERIASRMGVTPEKAAPHWIEIFSPKFRELWESGVKNIEDIEDRIYQPDPLGSNWADSVAAILISTPDPRI